VPMPKLLPPVGAIIAVTAIILIAACGTTYVVQHEIDRELTLTQARTQELKYCNILAHEVCQSADSMLVVHIPRELDLNHKDRNINSTVRLSNEGFDPITIEAYYIVLIDENDFAYEVSFNGPDNYNETRPFTPALTLEPRTDATIKFQERLNLDSRFIKAVKFLYRQPSDREFNQIMVSYKPVNPYEAAQVYMEAQQP